MRRNIIVRDQTCTQSPFMGQIELFQRENGLDRVERAGDNPSQNTPRALIYPSIQSSSPPLPPPPKKKKHENSDWARVWEGITIQWNSDLSVHDFSNLSINRTKSRFPLFNRTLILPPISQTLRLFKPIFISLGGSIKSRLHCIRAKTNNLTAKSYLVHCNTSLR